MAISVRPTALIFPFNDDLLNQCVNTQSIENAQVFNFFCCFQDF